jgi:hypothetical protein
MARERAKAALENVREQLARHADAWEEHHDACFDRARDAVASGEYEPKRLLSDLVELSLKCFGLTLECVLPSGATGPGATPARGVVNAITLDQRSQMGGPIRFPALDGSSPGPRLIAASGSSGGVPAANAYARILANGEAWASLVDLIDIDPNLPNGGHNVTIGGATLAFTRATLDEGKLLFGYGTIPPELENDPSLPLGDVLGNPQSTF